MNNIEIAFKYKEYSNIDWNNVSLFFNQLENKEFVKLFKDKINWNLVAIYRLKNEYY